MHRHVGTVVTLLAIVMVVDIIKPADRTFQDVPEHIQHSSRYWPHFKVHVNMVARLDFIQIIFMVIPRT